MKKIHRSWDLLNPSEPEKPEHFGFNIYYKRISSDERFQHIPKSVLEQWIHPHHSNGQTIKNYAWMNYEKIDFEIVSWNFDQLKNVHVVRAFEDYVKLRMSYSDFDQFCCVSKDIEYWKTYGTWKTPPIIIDLNSFHAELPEWSDLKPPFQLVEGHSRLGYLHSMKRISDLQKGTISNSHLVFLMKAKT